MDNNFQSYVTNKVLELWNTVQAFQSEMISIMEELNKNKKTLISKKAENPETAFEEVKELLAESMYKSYLYSLKEQDMVVNYIVPLVEYMTIVKMFSITTGLSEKEEKYITQELVPQAHSLYVLEKGAIVPKDKESLELIYAKAKEKFSDEKFLKVTFESPEFNPKK